MPRASSRARDSTTPARRGRPSRDASPLGSPSRNTRASSEAGGTPSRRRRLSSEDDSPPGSPARRTPSRAGRGRKQRETTPPRTPARSRSRAGSATPSRRLQEARSTSPPVSRGLGRPKKTPVVTASPAKPLSRLPPIAYDAPDDEPGAALPSGGDGDGVSPPVFEPAHFLRCHSTRGDPADVHTELWDCKFMPGGGMIGGIGDVVATCGGNSVCLLHAQTGTLLKKFPHPDIKERLGALAWSRLRLDAAGSRRITILAVGGTSRVYLLHPDNLTWYASLSAGGSKCREVTALAFHPRRSRWLLVATGDGSVALWDVGVPAPPLYDVTPRQLLRLETGTPPLALALHAASEMLLVGCEDGLRGWKVSLDVVKGERKPREVRYYLPPPPDDAEEAQFVDAVTVLGKDRVAVKCAGRGCVYVWPMGELLPREGKDSLLRVDLGTAPCRVLRWSDTDASYLGLGAGASLLAAGDDQGDIWIWNWRDSGATSGEPTNTLHWPRPQDDKLARARKLPLHRFPILVNRVCVSEDERHLVGVTHNNMVCIWRRADAAMESDADMDVD